MKIRSGMVVDFEADVVVVGGGITGLSMALSLVHTGMKVLLVDQTALKVEQDCGQETRITSLGYDVRVCAINEASKQLFESLDIWQAMNDSGRIGPFNEMHIWEEDGTGSVDLDARHAVADHLGYIIENTVMRTGLLRALSTSGVEQLPNAVVTDVLQLSDAVQITLKDGRIIRTSLLIGADGAESTIRQQAGIPSREWDYPHQALVTTVQVEKNHNLRASQIFLNSGPLAFLPLHGDGHHCSIVWSAEPDKIKSLKQLPDRVFCTELGAAFEYELGKILQVDQRQIIVLRQRHAKNYYRGRVLLVGDAAHTIHPLAGQGLNLGLSDVAVLSEILKKQHARCRGDNVLLGHESVIARYQRRRQSKNLFMMAAMEGLYRLFSGQNMALRWLRNHGMRKTNRFEIIKRKAIKTAMGV